MKSTQFLVGSFVLLAFLGTRSGGSEPERVQVPRDYGFKCVLFEAPKDRVVAEGTIAAEQIKDWFLSDYEVRGERTKIAKQARPIGVLIVTGGDQIYQVPCYRWTASGKKFYACQGYEIGGAPKFRALADSEKAFVRELKLALERIPGTKID